MKTRKCFFVMVLTLLSSLGLYAQPGGGVQDIQELRSDYVRQHRTDFAGDTLQLYFDFMAYHILIRTAEMPSQDYANTHIGVGGLVRASANDDRRVATNPGLLCIPYRTLAENPNDVDSLIVKFNMKKTESSSEDYTKDSTFCFYMLFVGDDISGVLKLWGRYVFPENFLTEGYYCTTIITDNPDDFLPENFSQMTLAEVMEKEYVFANNVTRVQRFDIMQMRKDNKKSALRERSYLLPSLYFKISTPTAGSKFKGEEIRVIGTDKDTGNENATKTPEDEGVTTVKPKSKRQEKKEKKDAESVINSPVE